MIDQPTAIVIAGIVTGGLGLTGVIITNLVMKHKKATNGYSIENKPGAASICKFHEQRVQKLEDTCVENAAINARMDGKLSGLCVDIKDAKGEINKISKALTKLETKLE